MKSKKLKTVLAIAVVAASGYSVFAAQKEVSMSDIMLANVEALTTNEKPDGYLIVNRNSIEVWDEETGTHKQVVTIVCEGVGASECV